MAPRMTMLGLMVAVSFVGMVAGTHFRYGTISWSPVTSFNEDPLNGNSRQVKFSMELVYRRDYNWGAYFKEAWSSDGTNFNTDIYYFDDNSVAGGYVDPPWYLKFPSGRHSSGKTLPNGIICTSPWDTGDSPSCGGFPVNTRINYRRSNLPTPGTGNYDYIEYDNMGLPIAGQTGVPCEVDSNPSFPDIEADLCSPWAETFGYFFGDGDSHTVVMSITEVNKEPYVIGNYLRGFTTFEHTYSSGKRSTSEPWVAFFTGGDRISKTKSLLNNNNMGRYRLEISVNVQGNNRSPVSTSMSVLPVPYTGRNAQSAYGYMATFQIAAFDPDLETGTYGNQNVEFYLANWRKQGALLGNSIPEGTYPALWYREEYETAWQAAFNSACLPTLGGLPDCSVCAKGAGKQVCVGDDCAEFNCEDYPYPWDPSKQVAHSPPDLVIDRATGIVQWETGINPFERDTAPYAADFTDSDGVVLGAAGTTPNKDPLEPGFWNLVVDIRSTSMDPCLSTVPPTCTSTDDIGHISIPLDFLLYLYPPMHMCSGDCLNDRNGIKTFRSDEGAYGWPRAGELGQVYNGDGTGTCTICGGGSDSLLHVYNPLACRAPNRECDGFLYNGTIGRNLIHRCTSEGSCCPGVVVSDSEPQPGPDVDHNYCNFQELDRTCVRNTGACQPSPPPPPPPSPPPPPPPPPFPVFRGGRRLQQTQTFGFQTIVPAYGACYLNTAPYWVDLDCSNEGNTPVIDPNEPAFPSPRAKVVRARGHDVRFDLVAADDDECNELSILHTGLYSDMNLMDHTFDSPKQVRRKFEWLAPTGSFDDPPLDTRPENTIVCFYPFDNYMVGIFRCVRIMLPKCARFESFPVREGENFLQMLYFRLFDCDNRPITDMPCEDSFTLQEDSRFMDQTESEMVCLKRIHAYTLLIDVTGSIQSIIDLVRESAKKFVSYIFDADCRADKVFSIAIFAGDKGLQYLKTFPSSFEPDTKEEVLSFLDLVIQSVNQFFRDRLATNLYGAIIQATADLDDYIIQEKPTLQYISTSLAVFTDGDDTTDYFPEQAAVDAVYGSPHNVYIVGVGPNVALSTLQALGKTGYAIAATEAEDLDATFTASAQALYEQTINSYALGYCSSARQNLHTAQVEMKGQLTGTPSLTSFTANELFRLCTGSVPSPPPPLPPSPPPPPPPPRSPPPPSPPPPPPRPPPPRVPPSPPPPPPFGIGRIPDPPKFSELTNRVLTSLATEGTTARRFRVADVPRLERALSTELGVSEASVEARPSVTVGMDLRLFGVSPGEVLTLELRYALTEIIYLTNDDAITVTYATKRRHLVQQSAQVTVEVAGPIEYEAQMLDGIQRVSDNNNNNPLFNTLRQRFPSLTDMTVLTQPARRSLDIPIAIDAGDATAAALVAAGLSRLADNPSSLTASLSQEGVQASTDDLSISLASLSIDIDKGKLCEVAAVLEGESDTYRRAVIESISNAEARIILSDANSCSPPSPPPMPSPQDRETQSTNTLLIVLIIGIVVALVLVCAFGTICVYMAYRRSQMPPQQEHVSQSQLLYPPHDKTNRPLLLELPGSPHQGPIHAFGKEPVAESSEFGSVDWTGKVRVSGAYEHSPLTQLSPPITPQDDVE